jgi:hypothetical protein
MLERLSDDTEVLYVHAEDTHATGTVTAAEAAGSTAAAGAAGVAAGAGAETSLNDSLDEVAEATLPSVSPTSSPPPPLWSRPGTATLNQSVFSVQDLKTSLHGSGRLALDGDQPAGARKTLAVFPERLDFGTVCEGVPVVASLRITNMGATLLRCKIVAPTGAGVSVQLPPGAIAAGMAVKATVTVVPVAAHAVRGEGVLREALTVVAEDGTRLKVPLVARVLAPAVFELLAIQPEQAASSRGVVLAPVAPSPGGLRATLRR